MITNAQAMSLVTKKVVNELDYSDFERIVQEVYDCPKYNFVADMEGRNGEAQTFSIKKEPIGIYEYQRLEEFIQTKKYRYLAPTLLQDLVNIDYLPEGDYVIEIFW